MTSVATRAYAFASTFRLKELASAFVGAEVKIARDELHAAYPDGSTAVAFDFGAVVFFGGAAPDDGEALGPPGGPGAREQTVAAIARKLADEPHPPLTEDLRIEIDPGTKVEVHFDRVVIPELSPAAMGVIALLLAQSVAMDYYDEDVEEILGRTGAISRDLATRGRMRGRVADVVRFIGSCIQTKSAIIESLALFDKPEATWEEEAIDRLYIRLREVLEIGDRYRALEYKLRMIQDHLVLLVDLSRQRQTIFLETTVVLLILFEVLVTIWQLWQGKP